MKWLQRWKPSSTDDTRPNLRHPAGIGFAIILIFFGGFGVWAAMAPLYSAAIAPGQIVVDSNRKVIQHLEGGIIKKIYVREGHIVKKGDPLVALAATDAQSNLNAVISEHYELLAKAARLVAERDNRDTMIYPKHFPKIKKTPLFQEIFKSQQAIFDSNRKAQVAQVNTLKKRIRFLQQEIKTQEDRIKAESRQYELVKREIDAVEKLAKAHFVAKNKLWALQREAARLQGRINEYQSEIAQAQQRIAQTELELVSFVNKTRQSVLTELRATQRQIMVIKERHFSSQDVVHRSVIKAPLTGTVVNLQVHTIGGVIKAGQSILDIVPLRDQLIIEARVSPLDIDVVRQGLSARVKLIAYSSRYHNDLNGKVVYVSADTVTDDKTGQAYYKARVKIDAAQLKKVKDMLLYPGMPVQVMIITGHRTFLDYLLKPIERTFDRAFRES